MIFDWNASRSWIPSFTATRLTFDRRGRLAEVELWAEWSAVDWSGLPCGWLLR